VPFELKDGITLSIAAIGAVLGTINTLHSLNQGRVKLRVIPKYAVPVIGGIYSSARTVGDVGPKSNKMACIEVINLSAFPVSLAEIGFTTKDRRNHTKIAVPLPFTTDGKPIARRLESREAVTGYFEWKGLNSSIDRAFAKTDCDEIRYGKSPALKEMLRRCHGSEYRRRNS
jgi:hypothetical protein